VCDKVCFCSVKFADLVFHILCAISVLTAKYSCENNSGEEYDCTAK
jgi:hypothetical protein